MSELRRIAVSLLAGVTVGFGAASTPAATLFDSDEPLEITLEAPWKQLTRGMEAGRSVSGRLSVEGESQGRVDLPVTITTRGLSRLDVCEFPLLTLELDAETALEPPFGIQRVVHLTSQCRRDTQFRDYLVLEYLSYEAYRLLDEPGLEVRLTSVDYLDIEQGRAADSSLAFFVEDLDSAASRSGRVWLEADRVAVESLSPEVLALLGLFQFMLGNTDWSVVSGPPGEPCCHNIAIFGIDGVDADLIPVPFDLDSTGLIDPPYAAPASGLPIRTVRQRLYRGFCESNAHLPQAIERFQTKRAELIALFEGDPRLSSTAKRRSRKYLEDFFEILEDPKRVKKRILDSCR